MATSDTLHECWRACRGSEVKLGEHGGVVEQVTLRYVQLRDYDGHVHFVPNGMISSVVNLGRGHAQAVIDISVACDRAGIESCRAAFLG